MSRVETIERRIQTYQRELRKLRLQLKIAKIEAEPMAKADRLQQQPTDSRENSNG